MTKFSDVLNRYRLRKKYTQRALAMRVNRTATYIGKLINAQVQPPPLEVCKAFSKALGLSEEEEKEFLEAAFVERDKHKNADFKAAFGGSPIEIKNDIQIFKIPIVSWVRANSFDDVIDSLPPGTADTWIHTTERGRNMFALKIVGDCMSPEFNDGDIIVVKPEVNPENGKFVVVKDSVAEKATFKQFKMYGEKTVLHPLNPKYDDIIIDDEERYKIIGVVVEKVKKY